MSNIGNTKELAFRRLGSGCLVPTNHKPQPNGYVRIVATRFGKTGRDYLHRLTYLEANGEGSIPEGWELDHLCARRDCCEPSHLWPIPPREHRYLTQMQRYDDQKEALRMLWHVHGGNISIRNLAKAVGIGPNPAGRWLKAIRAEEQEDRERWAA